MAEADDEAEGVLRRKRPVVLFSATIIDTEAARYGRDWSWGDKIVAAFDGDAYESWVCTVEVSARAKGDELIVRANAERGVICLKLQSTLRPAL